MSPFVSRLLGLVFSGMTLCARAQSTPMAPASLAPSTDLSATTSSLVILIPRQVDNLAALGQVWGFLKYFHPAVAAGQRDWDADFLRQVPAVLVLPFRRQAQPPAQRLGERPGSGAGVPHLRRTADPAGAPGPQPALGLGREALQCPASPATGLHRGQPLLGNRILYSSRSGLRIQDVKFEPHTGREFMAKLGESVKEIEDGRFKRALGAVKGGINDFLAQKFPQTLDEVQIGRVRGQEDLHKGFIGQPSVEDLVLVVAGVVADDMHGTVRVSGQ